MYEKLIKLKTNKPWLFWLLIVPFLFACILEFYNRYLINSAKNIIKNAKKADEKLKNRQEKAEILSDYEKQKSDEIQNKIDNTKVDKDWHLDD